MATKISVSDWDILFAAAGTSRTDLVERAKANATADADSSSTKIDALNTQIADAQSNLNKEYSKLSKARKVLTIATSALSSK